MRLPLVVVLVLALSLAGCLENMRDLKDRVTGAKQDITQASADVNASAQAIGDATNATPGASNAKPPVARIAVYGTNGALVYKATFVADDVATPVVIEAGAPLTLVGTDSEALGANGRVVSYQWTLAGKSATGAKVAASWNESGRYPVSLLVTDANGLIDTQAIVLMVPAKPFDVTVNQTSGQLAGTQGQGQTSTLKFEIKLAHANRAAVLQSVKIATGGVDTCDVDLVVKDKDGKVVGTANKVGVGATEVLTLPAIPDGTYSAELAPGDACVAKDGVLLSVTETFLPLL